MFASQPAGQLQTRLLKNRDKLFTFIERDAIPWNNNNAENAIKRFATYRRTAGRQLTEVGLTDYLVLLSICHTCHLKDIGFLKFMLSRCKSLDRFCENRHRRRGDSLIEIYPKGYTPPHRRKAANAGKHMPQERVMGLDR